jgi:hypothetical protein
MAYRTFTDSAGVEWQVWDVLPTGLGRTVFDRRRLGDASSATPERRSDLSARLANGWLAFLAGTDKRRLAPVPEGWADASVEQLERYCREAQPAAPAPLRWRRP